MAFYFRGQITEKPTRNETVTEGCQNQPVPSAWLIHVGLYPPLQMSW